MLRLNGRTSGLLVSAGCVAGKGLSVGGVIGNTSAQAERPATAGHTATAAIIAKSLRRMGHECMNAVAVLQFCGSAKEWNERRIASLFFRTLFTPFSPFTPFR
jgi:hypothetical protein